MAKKYDIDFLNNTVTLTASFLRKASVIGSAEYQEMLQLRRELPDYEFRKAETTKQKKTNKNKNLTYPHMRDFIRATASSQDEAQLILDEMKRVEALSKIQANPYKYVHDWFIRKFPGCISATTSDNSEETSATSWSDSSGAALC